MYSNIHIDTDAIGSKSKKQAIIKNNSIVRKHRINKKYNEDARCWVSQRALTSNKQCPMRIWVYLNNHNHWYISTNICLDHKHHSKLDIKPFHFLVRTCLSRNYNSWMSFMTWAFHHPKYLLYWILSEMMTGELFYQRLYSILMKNAGIWLTWQIESYWHVVMQKKLWSTFTCKFIFVMYIFGDLI